VCVGVLRCGVVCSVTLRYVMLWFDAFVVCRGVVLSGVVYFVVMMCCVVWCVLRCCVVYDSYQCVIMC